MGGVVVLRQLLQCFDECFLGCELISDASTGEYDTIGMARPVEERMRSFAAVFYLSIRVEL